jgi:acyl carrier protein phosphodiesterase
MIGNFIGDAVKGNPEKYYSENILAGIKMHRSIDYFTDNHPINKAYFSFLRSNFGKFSGVVADIFHDHFLARNWPITEPDLHTFVSSIYTLMEENATILPTKTQIMLPFMVKNNWLEGYATLEGINQVCRGMSRRIQAPNGLHLAGDFLKEHREECFQYYQDFFSDLEVEFRNINN